MRDRLPDLRRVFKFGFFFVLEEKLASYVFLNAILYR